MHRFTRKHGVRVTGISPACQSALHAHNWPGNVRELQNVIERAVILCSDGEDLQTAHLGFANLSAASAPASAQTAAVATAATAVPGEEILTLAELEKRHILLALEQCNGNRTHTARKLSISIRTLRNKLHEYGVGGKDDSAVEGEE